MWELLLPFHYSSLCLSFFLFLPRLPQSTLLFPYTTLFRSALQLSRPCSLSRRQQHSEGLQRLLQLDRRLEQPLDLQTVTRGDDQGRHPGGVDVGPHDPGGLVLAQTALEVEIGRASCRERAQRRVEAETSR